MSDTKNQIVINHLSQLVQHVAEVKHEFKTDENGLYLNTVVKFEGVDEPISSRMDLSTADLNRTFVMSRNVNGILEIMEGLIETNQITHFGDVEVVLDYAEA